MKQVTKLSIFAASIMMLAACGQKGPLFHAQDSEQNATTAPAVQTQAADVTEAQTTVQDATLKLEQQADGVVVEDALAQ